MAEELSRPAVPNPLHTSITGATPTERRPETQTEEVPDPLRPKRQPTDSKTVASNTGNDRVTVDKSNGPLVPITDGSSAFIPGSTQPRIVPAPAAAPSTRDQGRDANSTDPAANGTSGPAAARPLPVTAPPQKQTPPDEHAILEEATTRQRAPLVDSYAPYIIASDTTLEDARDRLRIAIEQTRQLRAAFTDRVYSKYRVPLLPPSSMESILTRILSDPKTAQARIERQIRARQTEKEIEKREASKLNDELAVAVENAAAAGGSSESSPNPAAAMNAENAEQLMYVSAGLSTVILPERDAAKDNIDMSMYPERAPINPETGHRVRGISAAAATAGEVILDRTRKAAAMRAERVRRRKLQLKSGNRGPADNNYSRLKILSNHSAPQLAASQLKSPPPASSRQNVPAPARTILPSTTKALLAARPFGNSPLPRGKVAIAPSLANAKTIRARVQASMSLNMLLSLNSSAEDLDGKPSSATKAMVERGVAPNNSRSNFQRFQHPFPESLGFRSALASGHANRSGPPLHPSFSRLALPPLKTAKERRTLKAVKVMDGKRASSDRAVDAISCVLNQFNEASADTQETGAPAQPHTRRINEISFLHGLRSSAERSQPRTLR